MKRTHIGIKTDLSVLSGSVGTAVLIKNAGLSEPETAGGHHLKETDENVHAKVEQIS